MNVVYMTLPHLFRFLTLLCASFYASTIAGQTLTAKEITHFERTAFANEFRQVQIFNLNSQKLLQLAQNDSIIHLKLGQHRDWLIALTVDPIFTPDYKISISNEKELQNVLSSRIQTFSGVIKGAETGTCRLTLSEGFIYGVFELKNKTYFIEPARRLNQTFGEDQYLFYESGDILPNPNGRCVGALLADKSNLLEGIEKSAGLCYTVQVGIAADYKMYQLFGKEVSLLEKYVIAILNSVRANYDDEFNHQIRFEINTLWVSTCETCDPWGQDTNYENLLANFRDWGNEGGFNATFDIATLWTGRVLDDNIGGGGYYGVLCGRLRYNVLRRYSENAGLMRALQAHELGHNLNARHDSTNSQTIMAPLIRDVQEWSAASKVSINNYFNVAIGLPNCIGACPALTPPTTDFFVLKSKGCAPLTVQFYNTAAANATQWEWTFAGGSPATSTAVNPLVTYNQPGVYAVTLKSSNAAGNSALTKTALIEVKGPPIPSFTIDYQMGTTTATFITNVIADSIRWQWGRGNTSKNTSVTVDFQQDGTYPITLITYNECGTDTLIQSLNIITPPQAGFSAANIIGCAPLTVNFNNESSTNAVEFEWQFAGGTPSTSRLRNPSVIYTKPGVYSVTLVARNAAGEVTKRSSNLVQVNDLPSAGFSSKTELNIVTFRNLSENGTVHYWNFGDGATANSTNPVHTYTSAGTFLVQLIAKNECGSDTIVKAIEIVGLPSSAAFAANAREGCAPFSVTFVDQSNIETEAWQWSFPGGEPSTSSEQNPTIRYNSPGTYRVELITSNFFGSDTLALDHYIQVMEKPEVDFDWTIQNQEVTFHLADGIQRGWEYKWQFGDGNSSIQSEPKYVYPNAGTFDVELIASNACGADTLRKTLEIGLTASKEAIWLEECTLYPNPHDGRFYLSLRGKPQAHLLLRTVNVLGQEVNRQNVDFFSGKLHQLFDFQYLANGIYWLEIYGDKGIFIKAFLIAKE